METTSGTLGVHEPAENRSRLRVRAALAALLLAAAVAIFGAASTFAASPEPSASGGTTTESSEGDTGTSGERLCDEESSEGSADASPDASSS